MAGLSVSHKLIGLANPNARDGKETIEELDGPEMLDEMSCHVVQSIRKMIIFGNLNANFLLVKEY